MTPDWRRELARLHTIATSNRADWPAWSTTTRRSRALSTAAVFLVDTAGVGLDELRDAGTDRLPQQVTEALERIAPTFDIETIASYPPAALAGLARAAEVALIEVEAHDATAPGDVELPVGPEEIRPAKEAAPDQPWISFGELLDEVVPQATYAVVAAQAGWRIVQGEPVAEVISWVKRRAGATTATNVIAGLAAMATGTHLARVPAVLGVSMAQAAQVELDRATQRLDLMAAIAGGLGVPGPLPDP